MRSGWAVPAPQCCLIGVSLPAGATSIECTGGVKGDAADDTITNGGVEKLSNVKDAIDEEDDVGDLEEALPESGTSSGIAAHDNEQAEFEPTQYPKFDCCTSGR